MTGGDGMGRSPCLNLRTSMGYGYCDYYSCYGEDASEQNGYYDETGTGYYDGCGYCDGYSHDD